MATDKNGNLYGYAGKIARINLTDSTVTVIPTSKYLPDYVGGRCMANKIFFDEAKPGVKALDPESMLIYMTGPTTGTGIPAGGRSVFTGIAPNCLPEQYCWSSLGGFFAAELKFAGWDGFILEGKAAEPTYLYIENDKIEFKSARNLWGKKVHDTQLALEDIHGHKVQSIVIGPAGENLVRIAVLATSNSNAAAKAGYGAVFGSKNLKAVTCRGTGSITPASVEKVLRLQKTMGYPDYQLRPLRPQTTNGEGRNLAQVPEGYGLAFLSCSYGCNQHCHQTYFGVKGAFSDQPINQVEKCVGRFATAFYDDMIWIPSMSWWTPQNFAPSCKMMAGEFPPPNTEDPDFQELYALRPGDTVGHWKPNWQKGTIMMDICNQYGLDKWDVLIWLFPWLAMGNKEGVFDDIDFGMPIDTESTEFVCHILDIMTFRKGYYGNLLAEGMARAIRTLGKEKFGDTIYHGRISNMLNKPLDIPISNEAGWGHSFHWSGRGYQGANDIAQWVPITIELMTRTRDSQSVTHHKMTLDTYHQIKDNLCYNPLTAKSIVLNENSAELKDTLSCCDFQSPNLYWTTMEAEMLEAATGDKWTEEMTNEVAERSMLLFRANLILNSGRCREQEVNEVFHIVQIPDAQGLTVSWEDFNNIVDLYYDERGWDRKTGWPTRATWEKYGLKDVADIMEKAGKLPA